MSYIEYQVSKKKVFLSWLWVGLCVVSIYCTIPVGRRIQKFVNNNWGREFFLYFVLGSLAAVIITMLYLLIGKFRVRSPRNYIWLLVVAVSYTFFTFKLKNIPEEAVHFLEYGVLGFFLFKALSHHIKDKSIYITATLLTLLFGIFDEVIQWTIPQRYWDFRDAALNGLSGGLFQFALWKVVRPKVISERVNLKAFRIFSIVLSTCLVLLGLCVINTPQRVAWYTQKIPFLSFLQREEPMSEFGYKHKDPNIGVFYSRLSTKKLEKLDEEKGKTYAQILNDSAHRDYKQFLREYNPISNPFLHELRVHIFRRDTYYDKAQSSINQEEKKEFFLIAYKENLIIKKYFNQSIKNSIYFWDELKNMRIGSFIDKNKTYESPVSSNLFLGFSEKNIWTAIIIVIVLLLLINLVISYRKSKQRI